MAILKYRKKPVEIEAILLLDSEKVFAEPDGEKKWEAHVEELHKFFGEFEWTGDDHGVYIETLEGTMTGLPGDYIIKGVKGEFYPCKPDIFELTYDLVTAS